ncbi:MAG TPA: uracil-DNA glycosylase family protein [Gemmatimonadaceae bacterium]|nr:uracil-DNA glycosylase family protein [Gemmatimonadaceae bacterium]
MAGSERETRMTAEHDERGGRRGGETLDERLARHRAALAACRRCGLHAVHGSLPIVSVARAPRVMLVGQAPGRTEVRDGRPFLGAAGRTLFRWLAQAGVDEATVRERIYIAAVTRCYPGPSPSGRGDRVPSPAERSACAGWLEAELRLIRPALLIPVGRLAIDALVGPRPLAEVVGRAHDVTHASGSSVAVPLPHPSGASSWVHAPGHRVLLDGALALLRDELAALGLAGPASAERVA